MRLSSILFFVIIFLSSCNTEVVFDDYKTFDDKVWNSDSLVVFNYSVSDTVVKNNIAIKVRHTVDYEFQNLFLFAKEDGVVTDTIEILLANKLGKWLGKGIGDVREVEHNFKQVTFPKTGNFTFEIEQAMRYGSLEKIKHLKAIDAVGLRIEKKYE